MLELGLETDNVPQSAERIVLTQLDDGISALACAGVAQTEGLHRAVAQGLRPSQRHHFDRHAAFEIRSVFFPFAKLGLLAVQQALHEREILVLFQWAVDVIVAIPLVPA